jgi:cell fate (sporulation/competence/biofilm development) regulator YmcA (YheA/YmcA/DUF963 family)
MSNEHYASAVAPSNMEHFKNTDLVVREDIILKTQELAELLSTSDEVQIYKKAEQQIASHKHIQTLISTIKKKQKEIVAFEKFNNSKMVEKIEQEIDVLQNELDAIPIVSEFKQTQTDINYLLQHVMSIIKDTISDNIHVESASEQPPKTCSD